MDIRRATADGRYPIRLSIAKSHKTSYIGTDIILQKEEWNPAKGMCIAHPHKALINRKLQKMKLEAEGIDLNLQINDDYRSMSANDIKTTIERLLNGEVTKKGDFEDFFLKFADRKSQSTRGVYLQTYSRLKKRYGEALHSLRFSDITPAWLIDFESFLAKTAPSANARGIHLRNIRAVFNAAITEEVTNHYPFRRFKIRSEKTRHRALSPERLRMLFDYPCQEYQQHYIDMFKLSFLLIGINLADLAKLKRIEDGRINYTRSKTHTPYSVKVEPEALELIKKHKGRRWLLDILDKNAKYEYYSHRCNVALQKVGKLTVSRHGKKTIEPEFPGLTYYWARHSWSTIASKIGIPTDVIGEALGHADKRVTKIYIDFDRSKIDRANRMVIDYVLYGLKHAWVNY